MLIPQSPSPQPHRLRAPWTDLRTLIRTWTREDRITARRAFALLPVPGILVLAFTLPQWWFAPDAPVYWAGVWCSATLLIYLIFSRSTYPLMTAFAATYAASFQLWCGGLARMSINTGGRLGVPHALLTAVMLIPVTRSFLPGIGSCVGIALAIVVAPYVPERPRLGPSWTPVIIWNLSLAASLALWSVQVRSRQRWLRQTTICRTCGYDLKGLPTPTCPECGHRNG